MKGEENGPEEDYIFKPPESPHFQPAADKRTTPGPDWAEIRLLFTVFGPETDQINRDLAYFS